MEAVTLWCVKHKGPKKEENVSCTLLTVLRDGCIRFTVSVYTKGWLSVTAPKSKSCCRRSAHREIVLWLQSRERSLNPKLSSESFLDLYW